MALDYRATMLRAFQKELAMRPATIKFAGKEYSVTSFPKEQSKNMTPSSYEERIPCNLDMLATDFESSGISVRSVISYQDKAHEVFSVTSDPNLPFVTLATYLKQ